MGLNSSSAMIRAADAARAAYSVNVPILAPTSRMIESSEFYGIGRREEYGPEGGEIEEGFQPDREERIMPHLHPSNLKPPFGYGKGHDELRAFANAENRSGVSDPRPYRAASISVPSPSNN